MQNPIIFKPNPLDFSPISDAIGNWQGIQFKTAEQEMARNRLAMDQKRLGFEEARLGMEKELHPLQKTRMEQGNERERQSLPLDLAAKRTANSSASLDVDNKRRDAEKDLAGRFAALAQMWENEPDLARQREMLARTYAADPRFRKGFGEVLPKEVLDDPVVVARYARAIAAGYQAPQVTKVSEGDTLVATSRDPTNPSAPPKVAPVFTNPKNDQFKDEHQLRGELSSNPTVKNFSEIKSGYGRMLEGQNAKTGAGDLAIVYGYMKMLDPTSVVREGEFATAEKTAGVPEQVRILYNKVLSGERLSDAVRQNFLGMSDGLYRRAEADVTKVQDQYRTLAQRYKLRPENVIIDQGIATPPPSRNGPPAPPFNPAPPGMRDAVNALPPAQRSVPISPDAVRALQANPERAAEFDAKYGPGASRQFLTPR